jgi:hypothetical protein
MYGIDIALLLAFSCLSPPSSDLFEKAKISNHKIFLTRCRDNQLVPKGLKVKIPQQLQSNWSSTTAVRKYNRTLVI